MGTGKVSSYKYENIKGYCPKDTSKAAFIKYFSDKTVVFNNQIITGLWLLRTHGCKHCQTRGFSLANSTGQSFYDFKLYTAVKLR